MANHSISKAHNHTRWNNQLVPVLEVASGDVVEMECHDSSGGQVTAASTLADYAANLARSGNGDLAPTVQARAQATP